MADLSRTGRRGRLHTGAWGRGFAVAVVALGAFALFVPRERPRHVGPGESPSARPPLVAPAAADILARKWYQCVCVDTSGSRLDGRACAVSQSTARMLARQCYRENRKPEGSVTCDCSNTDESCEASKGQRCEGF